MPFFGIEFTPLRVPLDRRFQTLAAALWVLTITLGGPVGFATCIYILFFTQYLRYLALLYLVFQYIDKESHNRGGREGVLVDNVRSWKIWKILSDYFPVKLVKTVDLDSARNYLFCLFPHGIFANGAMCAFLTDHLGFKQKYPGITPKVATLNQFFHMPFLRELFYSFGACSVSAESLNYLLSEKNGTGRAVVLVPGGVSESFYCKPRTYKIILNRRKGFIRIALKNGTPLVPVLSFGETDLYDHIELSKWPLLRKIQGLVKSVTGIAPMFFVGRGFFQYTFGIIPRRKPITVVVGSPMEVPMIPEPAKGEVDEYHKKFSEKLVALFESEKHKYLENPEKFSLDFV